MPAEVPSLLLTLRANAKDVYTATAGASAAVDKMEKDSGKSLTSAQKGWAQFGQVNKAVAVGVIGSAVAIGISGVKMAAGFQEATTQLVTGAGESTKNIDMIRKGLLAMAPAVGMGPEALAKGMFLVESAGYHGAAGLTVMKAAAEGAKIGGADATVVADALTTALTDFQIPAAKAAETTSKLVATVAAGKTNMQDLAGSLSAVAPVAAAAHINLDQLLGAMGTMTGQGISAQQSAQDLANTIRSLSNPTQVMTKNMAQMGLNSMDVAQQLGKKGLTGTMDDIYQAIMDHMGPGGKVLESAFNQSKLAAQSAQTMLEKLPPSLQGLGKELLNNQITQKEWTKSLRGQDVLTANLGRQFASTAKNANGFSQQLRSGQGPAMTFNGILANMTGGATGLGTSLALTGGHADTFAANVKSVSNAATEAGGHVKGWGETQKDFNTQLAQAQAGLTAMAIAIGTALMPAILTALKIGQQWAAFLSSHTVLLNVLIGVIGTVVGAMIAFYVTQKMIAAYNGMVDAVKSVTGGLKLLVLGYKDARLASRDLTGAMGTIGGFARQATDGIKKMVAALFLQKDATIAQTAATEGATVAQEGFDAAADANPIGIIIMAIVALIAAIVWLVTHWKQATKFLQDTWAAVAGFISTVVGAVINWLKANWPLVLDILLGPLGFVIGWIIKNWGAISGFFSQVFHAIGAIFTWLYDSIIKPWVDAITIVIKIVIVVMYLLWLGVIQPALKGIGALFTWLWDSIIKPAIDLIVAGVKVWGAIFTWLWQNAVIPAIQGVAAIFKWLYENIVVPIVANIQTAIRVVGLIFTWLWQSVVMPALHGIADVVNWVYNSIIRPVFQWIGQAVQTVGSVFSQVFGGIASIVSGAFNGVVDTIRGVFNTVISLVNGVIGGINSALSAGAAIGIHVSIPKIPSLDVGGFTPGAPGQGTLAMIHGGEYMLSQRMLAGQQPIHPAVAAAVAANASGGGKPARGPQTTNNITVNAQTDATPEHIAQSVAWELWRLG